MAGFSSSSSRSVTPGRGWIISPLAVVASLALAFVACGSDDDQSTAVNSNAPSTQSDDDTSGVDDTPSDPAPGAIPGELGRWTDQSGLERIYVEVDNGITDDELVNLATGLHEDHPDVAKFYLMDDDSQIDQVLDALPETEQGNTDNWPLEWVTDHTLAVLELTIFPDEPQRRWLLDRGLTPDPENPLAELV